MLIVMKRFAALFAVLVATVAHSQVTAPPQVQVSAAELNTATTAVNNAWNDFNGCRRPSACKAYFESFGVAISFGDGSIVPFSHVQRLTATSRDCIKNAKSYLEQGNRSMAVQWVMASRIEDVGLRGWLGNHPDAVLEALRRCCR
jgi:hypothetical protein